MTSYYGRQSVMGETLRNLAFETVVSENAADLILHDYLKF